mmetsp:Transcript_91194/g.232097  ORF Transcript_91194/g.232097 Transcript_91194/m.232097 type:complete len:466 (+) Transcript_91194:370-1767(+)
MSQGLGSLQDRPLALQVLLYRPNLRARCCSLGLPTLGLCHGRPLRTSQRRGPGARRCEQGRCLPDSWSGAGGSVCRQSSAQNVHNFLDLLLRPTRIGLVGGPGLLGRPQPLVVPQQLFQLLLSSPQTSLMVPRINLGRFCAFAGKSPLQHGPAASFRRRRAVELKADLRVQRPPHAAQISEESLPGASHLLLLLLLFLVIPATDWAALQSATAWAALQRGPAGSQALVQRLGIMRARRALPTFAGNPADGCAAKVCLALPLGGIICAAGRARAAVARGMPPCIPGAGGGSSGRTGAWRRFQPCEPSAVASRSNSLRPGIRRALGLGMHCRGPCRLWPRGHGRLDGSGRGGRERGPRRGLRGTFFIHPVLPPHLRKQSQVGSTTSPTAAVLPGARRRRHYPAKTARGCRPRDTCRPTLGSCSRGCRAPADVASRACAAITALPATCAMEPATDAVCSVPSRSPHRR